MHNLTRGLGIHTAFVILRMVMTEGRNVRFAMVRLREITFADFQFRVPLRILVDCEGHVNYDLSIDLKV